MKKISLVLMASFIVCSVFGASNSRVQAGSDTAEKQGRDPAGAAAINKAIISLLAASDHLSCGWLATAETANRLPGNKAFRIHPDIYSARQALKVLQNDLGNRTYSDGVLRDLRETLLEATSISLDAVLRAIEALEARTIKSSVLGNTQNYPSPDLPRAAMSVRQVDDVIVDKIDRTFVLSFIEMLKRDDPKLENNLPPFLYEVYENRDMSEEQILAKDKSHGHLGIATWKSSRIPVVLSVRPNGPASVAKILRGDILLGADDNYEFKTQMDYRAFQEKTKSGETHRYLVNRGGKTITVSVTLD